MPGTRNRERAAGNKRFKATLQRGGSMPHETVFFSSLVTRVLPQSWYSSGRYKRQLVVTEAAVYECSVGLSPKVLQRVELEALGCVSLSRLSVSGTFALMVPGKHDSLFETPRRAEIVSWMLHLYEARTQQALIVNFMQSILLTQENGDVMSTYFDESSGNVVMTRYDASRAAAGANGGRAT